MKIINIYVLFLMMVALLPSCSKENPFNNVPVEEPVGSLAKKALGVDVLDASMIVTRAGEDSGISLDDFDICVYQTGVTTPKFHDKYGNMPEILTLPRGEYYVEASYGENVDKGWESPYYKGKSETFLIKGGEITDNIGEIKCRLTNVKVSVDFGPVLLSKVSNPNVEVKVCDIAGQDVATGLTFTKLEAEKERCGFFRYEPGVTLVAVFDGLIDGDLTPTHEVKTITNLEGGKHYKITFKLHVIDGDPGGGIAAKMAVDAHLVVTDVERNVDIEEDEILDDNERPKEDDENPEPPQEDGPSVMPEAPINFDKVNDVKSDSHVVINISSKTGITKFQVNIISDDLNGLVPEVLDLVTPGDNLSLLQGLGLLEDGKTTVKGDKNVTFDVSGFMEMLCALGPEKDHTFRLTIADESGEVVKELKLHTKE